MALLTIKPTQVDIEIASKVADHTDVAIAVSLNLLQAWKTGGAAVDVFALALTPSFADDVCSPDTSKNASKSDGRGGFLRRFSTCRENYCVKTGIEPMLLLFAFFSWCPWPAVAYSHNHLNLSSFYPSIAADTSRNTSKVTRGVYSSQK